MLSLAVGFSSPISSRDMGGEGDSSDGTAVGVGSAAEAGEELATVNIRCSNGSKFSVQTALASTVGAFKALVAQNCDVPPDQQRLIYKGLILKDDQTLESYGLQADHTVHMVRGFTTSATTTTSVTVNSTTNAAPANTVRSAPANEAGGLGGAGLGASLFPGLGLGGLGGNVGSALFGSGFPDFEQLQQQLAQNPNMMREMMNISVQSVMNNPDLMRSLIMSNPQMREIIDRNPELAHIFNDPSILRQTLETARNPELMREMMRNTDRAMSNIESTPEGFNALRRMYENVQEPLLNATTLAGDAGTNLSANPFAALLGNQGGGQQRNVSNNSSTGSDPNFGTVPNANPLPNPWTPSGGTQTNTATRSNPAGDVRPPSLGSLSGLGGLIGLPELDPTLLGGGAQDPALFTQLLQNPAMSQMLQSLLSNPQYMDQMMNMSSQLRATSDSNPQFREMMQNPEILRRLTSPEMMQQMLTLQQTLQSQLNRPSNQAPSQTGEPTGNTNTNSMTLEMLRNMLGGLGTGGGLGSVANPNVPLEELYATQLSQLREMGFFDTQENLRVLQVTRGNVHAAVERLLNPGP